MSNLEEAVKIKEGTTVKSIISCDGLHKLTRDKSYTVNSVTPLFRTGPPDYVSNNSQRFAPSRKCKKRLPSKRQAPKCRSRS